MRRGDRHRPTRQRGFTLVFGLFAVAAAAAGAMLLATQWTRDMQREKEAELLRVGDLYAQAIASYYQTSSGSVKRYPPDLQSLLEDRRYIGLHRHLRALYADPVTGSTDWGMVRADDGGIMGVYSRSDAHPWRRIAARLDHSDLLAAQHYSEWKFIAKVQ